MISNHFFITRTGFPMLSGSLWAMTRTMLMGHRHQQMKFTVTKVGFATSLLLLFLTVSFSHRLCSCAAQVPDLLFFDSSKRRFHSFTLFLLSFSPQLSRRVFNLSWSCRPSDQCHPSHTISCLGCLLPLPLLRRPWPHPLLCTSPPL